MRSARPHGTAARMPWPFISNTFFNDGTVAERKYAPGRAGILLCGRAEPAPPRRGQGDGIRPPEVRPRECSRGGFLGGARSLRPGCQALLMPGRSITRDGWPKARGLTETCPDQAQASFNGRAEPAPPRRGQEPSRSSCALAGRRRRCRFFFGGAHSVRPDGKAVCRPRHFTPPDPLRIARWPSRDMPRSGHTHPRGRPRRPWVGVEPVERRP
jgi:hypothetical protein